MNPSLTRTVEPSAPPVTIDEITSHVRIDSDDDLAYLTSLISVARDYVESVTGRACFQSTWRLTAPSWHSIITGDDNRLTIPSRNIYSMPLGMSPLVSVSSVKYYDTDDTQQTLDSSAYRVITTREPGLIQIIDSPPGLEDRPDAVEITFVAGYAAQCDIPEVLRHAVKLLVCHLYEQRVPAVTGTIATVIPFSLEMMLKNQKIGGWIA